MTQQSHRQPKLGRYIIGATIGTAIAAVSITLFETRRIQEELGVAAFMVGFSTLIISLFILGNSLYGEQKGSSRSQISGGGHERLP